MTPSLLDLHRAVLVPIDAVFAQLYEMMSEIISFPCGFGKWLASLLALLFVPLLALLLARSLGTSGQLLWACHLDHAILRNRVGPAATSAAERPCLAAQSAAAGGTA